PAHIGLRYSGGGRPTGTREVIAAEVFAGDRACLPVNRTLHALILQPAKTDQRPQQITIETMDHQRWRRWSCFPASSFPGGKSSRPGLAVGQHIGACRLHTWVCAISSQLVEKDELPDSSTVLGRIPRARFDP